MWIKINGEVVEVKDPSQTLLRFLREECHLFGAKNGCETGQCGSCTVIVNGRAERSCSLPMARLQGAAVETIEGLERDGKLHPLQAAFLKLSAFQCGFCTPGMIMAAKALLDKNQNPTKDEIKKALSGNICRCTGYNRIVAAVELAAKALREGEEIDLDSDAGGVGQRTIRVDGYAKVTGQPTYTDDFPLENMVHGKILFSKYPHARILSVDTSQAKVMPGVLAVATYHDVPGRKDFGQGTFPQQPVIAGEKARYVGDPVAVVFAETESQALAAREKILVDYQPLPVITDPEQALKEGAVKIHKEGNLLKHFHFVKGDVKRGFHQADYIVENEFSVGSIDHGYLEPDAALASVDDAGVLTVFGSVQGPINLKKDLMACLSLESDQVRIVNRPNGGAFGGREEPSVHILAGLGALMTGRATRLVFSREELNLFSVKRHAMKMHYKLGATRDGKLTAIEVRTVGDTGAYASSGEYVLYRAVVFGAGPYEVPNADMKSWAVYTNNVTAGSMRGFGSTQPTFAMEIILDQLARQIGMDPFEIRRINGLVPGRQTLAGHIIEYGCGFQDALEVVRQAVVKQGLPEPSGPGKRIGIGVAGSMKNVGLGSGAPDNAWGQVELSGDGTILIHTGGVEFGQGHLTVVTQIAASELNIPVSALSVAPFDTRWSLDGGITTASRQTFVSGNAVKLAAREFKADLLDFAAGLLGRESSELDMDGGGVYVLGGMEDDRLSFSGIAAQAGKAGRRIHAKSFYEAPKTSYLLDRTDNPSKSEVGYRTHFSYSFGVQAVVVEVDLLTGEVVVKDVYAANDVGRAINPELIEGQIEGGVAMGIGYALSEKFDMKDGYVLSRDIASLGLPGVSDMPDEIKTFIVEENHPFGPFGAKGMGELPVNNTAPAIVNAIYDAVGVQLNKIPIRPEELLQAIRLKESALS